MLLLWCCVWLLRCSDWLLRCSDLCCCYGVLNDLYGIYKFSTVVCVVARVSSVARVPRWFLEYC